MSANFLLCCYNENVLGVRSLNFSSKKSYSSTRQERESKMPVIVYAIMIILSTFMLILGVLYNVTPDIA